MKTQASTTDGWTIKMFKFSFDRKKNKAITAKKRNPLVLNLNQLVAQQEAAESSISDKIRQEKAENRRQHLNAPYAVYSGDPDYHVTRNPNAEPGRWNFVHHSITGNDSTGRSIASSLKEELDKHDSAYEKVFVPPSQYADDEVMTKHAPKGMVGYKLKKSKQPIRSDSKQERELYQIQENAKVQERMRQRTSDLPAVNAPEFDPTHPLNLIANYGGSLAIKKMFTDQVPYAQAKPGQDVCVCGREASKHTDAKSAKDHHEATGEHLEIHEYTPQFVVDSEGNQTDGNDFRAAQSPLRYATLPSKDSKGNYSFKEKKVDEGTGGDYMPMVVVGTTGTKFNRVTTSELYEQGKANKLNKFTSPVKLIKTKCPHCTNGRIDPYKRSNEIPCGDCTPGEINFKDVRDADGKVRSTPYSIGAGNGKIRLFDEKDAPKCESCNGKGNIASKDKTAGDVLIPCRACKSTGKLLEATEGSGIQCNNCNSHDSTITTTPGNTCTYCDGKGISKEETVSVPAKVKLDRKSTPFEGNPIIMRPFSKETSQTNTNVDGYLAHANPECTRCHGNDEYQTADKTPCNCRIGSFSNKEHVIAPSGSRFIFPDRIEIPADKYLESMKAAYPDDTTNPHRIKDLNNTFDPITNTSPNNPTGHRYVGADGRPNEASMYTHVWRSGVNLPAETLAELNRRSAENHKSVNAKYTAASADLAMVLDAVKDFHKLPINIAGQRQSIKKPVTAPNGRVKASTFHPAVQPAITKVEKAIDSLGDSDRNRYNVMLDNVYQNASHVAHDMEVTGKSDSPHYDKYQNSVKELLSTVSRFHGDEKVDKVQKALTSLPKKQVPSLETAKEESTNA